jgi:hypothetical protein
LFFAVLNWLNRKLAAWLKLAEQGIAAWIGASMSLSQFRQLISSLHHSDNAAGRLKKLAALSFERGNHSEQLSLLPKEVRQAAIRVRAGSPRKARKRWYECIRPLDETDNAA